MTVKKIIRLITGVFVVSLISVILLIISFYVERNALKNKEVLRAAGIQLSSASDLLTNQARCYVQYGDKKYYDLYMKEIEVDKNREKAVETLKKYKSTNKELALVQKASDLSNTLAELETEAFNAVASGDLDKARHLMFGDAYENGKLPITNTMEEFQRELDKRTTNEANRATVISTIMIVISMLCLISMIITTMVSLKNISAKIDMVGVLAGYASEIAKGNILIEIDSKSEDEIGVLANAFMDMVAAIKTQAGYLQVLSDGDFTNQVPVRSENDQMNIAINSLIDSFNQVMSEIRLATTNVSEGSKQIASGSQVLAEAAVEQTSEIEKLSVSIDAVSDKTKNNSDMASKAAALATDIIDSARKGSSQMTRMIEAVKEINNASQNIRTVIKTIDDIATQTNLLSLNAAIEAARAGEQGKGFSVVAGEVRDLASKSAAAAKDTEVLIKDSIEKAMLGVKIAEETSASLEEIVERINESTSIVNNIAGASHEQTDAIRMITYGVGQVAQVIEQNSAAAEESAAAAEEMNAQSFTLDNLVGRFKLK